MTDLDRTLVAVRHHGWSVVLLRPCSKKPEGRAWRVTTDVDVIAGHVCAGGNVGVLTHANTGLAVLDPDDLLGWADMVDTLGQPAVPWVETGSGRLHFYVTWEPDLPARLSWRGEAIGEIQRGPGQQMVVMPPSLHPKTGHAYRWLTDLVDPTSDPLPRLPGEWLAYLRSHGYARLR